MLINLSNHPYPNWGEAQKTAAARYGEVEDLPFPNVDAAGDEEYIAALADEYAQKVSVMANGKNATVHLMGEMTLTFALLQRLLSKGFYCIASTSERIVCETAPGQKNVTFKFVKFRCYEL